MKYAIRIPANETLQRDIEELLKRPVGRPSLKPLVEYKGFLYQAESWKTARRVVAKVEHHPVTDLSSPSPVPHGHTGNSTFSVPSSHNHT